MREGYRGVAESDMIGPLISVYVSGHWNDKINEQYIYVREYHPNGNFANLRSSSYQIDRCEHNDQFLEGERNYMEYNMCIDKRDCTIAHEDNAHSLELFQTELPYD